MKHTYSISGMSCNNCRAHVERALYGAEGVTRVLVDLKKAEAEIEMEYHVPLEKFQEVLYDSRWLFHKVHSTNRTITRFIICFFSLTMHRTIIDT